MFKLITEEEERKLLREYSARRAIVISATLSLVLVVGLVGLSPSYLLSYARKGEATERSRVSSVLKGEEGPVLWIADINTKLNALLPEADSTEPSKLIEAVINSRTTGIRITNISWSSATGEKKLAISGIAVDRRSLIEFEKSVNALGLFSSVALPVSNLAQDRDIEFSLNLIAI